MTRSVERSEPQLGRKHARDPRRAPRAEWRRAAFHVRSRVFVEVQIAHTLYQNNRAANVRDDDQGFGAIGSSVRAAVAPIVFPGSLRA